MPNLTSNSTCLFGEDCWNQLIDLANRSIFKESIPIVVFMVVMIVGGIPGNLLVIAVYTKHKKKTNAVFFIWCLAIIDLMTVCIFHPYIIFKLFYSSDQDWVIPCKLFEFGIHASLCVSVATLLTVAIDRFIAIYLPMKYFRYKMHVYYIMTGLCIFGVVLSSPILVFYGKHDVIVHIAGRSVRGFVCDVTNEYQNSSSLSAFASFMFFMFIAVCSCLVVLYSCVARKAYMARKVIPAPTTTNNSFRTASEKVTLSIVSITSEGDLRSDHVESSSRNIQIPSFEIEIGISQIQTPTTSGAKQISQLQRNDMINDRKIFPKKLKAAKMLSLVTLVFILSWLPFFVIRLSAVVSKNEEEKDNSFYQNVPVNFMNHLFYLNNAANPLIYALVHKTFREDCLKLFKREQYIVR